MTPTRLMPRVAPLARIAGSGRGFAVGALFAMVAALALQPATRAQEPALTPEERAQVQAEAVAQASRADKLLKARDFAAALALYEAERASRARIGDRKYEAFAVRSAGCCRRELGDFDAALDDFRAARELDARGDDHGLEGYDWYLIGELELIRERPAQAVKPLEAAVGLLSTAIDRDHECDARILLGRARIRLDEPAAAVAHLERALDLSETLRDARRRALAAYERGRAAYFLGGAGLAAERFEDALRGFIDQKRDEESASARNYLALALWDLESDGAARAQLEAARDDWLALGNLANHAAALERLALWALDDEDFDQACALLRRALASRLEAGDDEGRIEPLTTLGATESKRGDWNAALAAYNEALKIARDGPPERIVELALRAAEAARQTRDVKRSEALIDQAEHAAAKSADKSRVDAVRRSADLIRALDIPKE